MTCEEFDELLPSYALDALPANEAAEAREHLVSCRRHDDELAGMNSVAASLPLAAPQAEPPAELRSRLLAAFDAEVEAQAPATMPRLGVRWVPRRRPSVSLLAAAALFVALMGVLAWNVALQIDDGEGGTVRSAFVGDAGGGELVYLKDDALAFVSLDLPAPPPDRVYQAWGIEGESATSLGLVSSDGRATFTVDLSEVDAVAVSEEPQGGSDQPTSAPLLVATVP